MNTRRKLQVFLASALGGAILLLALWLLSPTVLQPVVAHEIEGATLQTLPPPFLNYDDVADAPFDNPPSPMVDGLIAPGEYAGAGKVTFPGYGGDVEVFFKEDGAFLYVAFDFPDPQTTGSAAQLFLDTKHDGGTAPQNDDYRLSITRAGSVMENRGTGTDWATTLPISWTAASATTLSGWQAEFAIQYDKLGLTPGTFQVLGLSMINAWTPSWDHYWPSGAFWTNPDTWGSLVSSSDWDIFYWKPGPWEDYAPSGMPDFDQNQQGWLAYDGPAAAANSLWWFDSKFEALTGTMPPVISDTYRLVRSYDPTLWDDHHYSNTIPLIGDLARNYFGTNRGITGTDPISMFHGIHRYLRDKGLWDDYIVTLVDHPAFKWVADEVMRSEDVILLLGFYEWRELEDRWARVGGHYVNVAGVDPGGLIAFSDPAIDAAGQGWPGRVLSGTLILPHQPGHASYVHNDAGNVSHDVYPITTTNSPGGDWGPAEYPWWMAIEMGLIGANPNPLIDMEEYGGGELQVEVEVALAVSPYTWKASGEWIPDDDDPIWGVWQPWQDYAPNGMPDFDQKQGGWQSMFTPQWTFCGPVAAANSLWWFDSKFEPNPISPLPYNDNYPLVQTYDPSGAWDDHDPLNVDDTATPWPPGGFLPPPPPPMPPGQGEFIEDLALYFHT
ncbi:MAG: hypothetical protein J7M17_01215, partial [Anaerolineae bacterium]|nr:hypothetical protein [Anaerolineae bacterium]